MFVLLLFLFPLQTRTTIFASFPGFERLRAPMGPILGGIGSLGDGGSEEIAGDKKKSAAGQCQDP